MSKQNTHTPGPWGVGWNGGLTGPTVAPTVNLEKDDTQIPIHCGNTAVAFVLRDGKATSEDHANARLLASAPDLMMALELVRMSRGWQFMSTETRDIVDAALAKATGQGS